MKTDFIRVSAIVPTRNRPTVLAKTLESLAAQGVLPAELIVVDGSEEAGSTEQGAGLGERGAGSREVVESWGAKVSPQCVVRWLSAEKLGAAAQRNQGVASATQPAIWFFDDDILFEPECVNRLWRALESDAKLGGVNAMIVNQRYQSPGVVSRLMFTLMNGRREKSFAGRVLGPAVNLLPEDRDDLPEVVPVEWLNTTCTMYRREALPSPPFDSVFTGYSMMEDLTLSLRVRREWKLANARTARIVHDSQPGAHKADVSDLAAMELVNRHYVMKEVLGRTRRRDYLRLLVWEMFQLFISAARGQSRKSFPAIWRGKWRACRAIAAR